MRRVPSEGGKPSHKGKRPRIEEPVSAGGVVYRVIKDRVEVVLCGRENPERWSLAKGTPDPGETLEETALREVREETGLEVKIQEPVKSIDYWFADRDSDVRFHKTVHFYLMEATGGDTEQHDPEFDVVRWFPYDQALKSLTYANEAEVLKQALELISKRMRGGKDGGVAGR